MLLKKREREPRVRGKSSDYFHSLRRGKVGYLKERREDTALYRLPEQKGGEKKYVFRWRGRESTPSWVCSFSAQIICEKESQKEEKGGFH